MKFFNVALVVKSAASRNSFAAGSRNSRYSSLYVTLCALCGGIPCANVSWSDLVTILFVGGDAIRIPLAVRRRVDAAQNNPTCGEPYKAHSQSRVGDSETRSSRNPCWP